MPAGVVAYVNPALLPVSMFRGIGHVFIPGYDDGTNGPADMGYDVPYSYPFVNVPGERMGLDNNYQFAVFPDGRVTYLYVDSRGDGVAWGDGEPAWLISPDVSPEGYPIAGEMNGRYRGAFATYDELIALGLSPYGVDAHGVPLFPRGWVPATYSHPDGPTLLDTLGFEVFPAVMFAAGASFVGGAALSDFGAATTGAEFLDAPALEPMTIEPPPLEAPIEPPPLEFDPPALEPMTIEPPPLEMPLEPPPLEPPPLELPPPPAHDLLTQMLDGAGKLATKLVTSLATGKLSSLIAPSKARPGTAPPPSAARPTSSPLTWLSRGGAGPGDFVASGTHAGDPVALNDQGEQYLPLALGLLLLAVAS